MALFRDERAKWSKPVHIIRPRNYPGLMNLGSGRNLFETNLPRGALLARLTADKERMNYWMSPGALMRHRFVLGQLIVGKLGDTLLGHLDDRPMVTIASARSGKSSTVLEPNLYLYPGSMLVLDPKGELAKTAAHRRAMGHNVYVVDPYGLTGGVSACWNCLEELDDNDPSVVDRVYSIVAAKVPDTEGGGGAAKYFNDSSRAWLTGVLLYVLTMEPAERNLVTVRQLVTLSYPPLIEAAQIAAKKARAAAKANGQTISPDASYFAVTMLLKDMVRLGSRFGGIASSIGSRFLTMTPNERSAVFSTAAVHTDFLDSLPLRDVIQHSDFELSTLRADKPATIYLVLPVGEIERQFRLLRLFVQLACLALERMGPYPRERPPILFMMEEFAVLKHMPIMEQAAAYFPGFGIKLWTVLQSLEQLINDYKGTYQTIMGNAGLIQMFSAGDDPALTYAASRVGKLIEPLEMRQAFSRSVASQLLLMEGKPPAAAMRLNHEDVDRIRQAAHEALCRPRLTS
jgi:type IV secretion system protein VirD4